MENTADLEVRTVLSTDQNLTQVGTKIETILCNVEEEKEEDGEKPRKEAGAHLPISAIVRSQLGTSAAGIKRNMDDTYSIVFTPMIAEERTIEIKYHDKHIPGSPFALTVIENWTPDEPLSARSSIGSRSSVSSGSMEIIDCIALETGQPVNVILPVRSAMPGEILDVSVEGPLGLCESSINDEMDGVVGVRFVPNMTGEYFIHMKQGGLEIIGSPLRLAAKGDKSSASKCFVLEEDMIIFKKSRRFGKGPASFRVSTRGAGQGRLDVVSRGPGKAKVKIHGSSKRVETCQFTPSAAGRYEIDILWNGRHIQGSPFKLHFKQPKARFGSSGLDLQDVMYCVGKPHRFKLDCQEVGDGILRLVCTPESAANVSVSLTETSSSYLCEVLPMEVGTHELALLYKGNHIVGSPFKVHFKAPTDPSKCRMIKSSDSHEVGDSVTVQISTEGAGEGELAATALNVATQDTIPVLVRKLNKSLYTLEFNPGQEVKCRLSVTFDGVHIRGSPFQLLFSDNISAEGEGLVLAQTGRENKFSVFTRDRVSGKLTVTIEGDKEGDREVVKPTIYETEDRGNYEVSYIPMSPGSYKVSVMWGDRHAPGSPFTVPCFQSADVGLFKIRDPVLNAEVYIGSEISFSVETPEQVEEAAITVDATSTRGSTTQGTVTRDPDGSYYCILNPSTAGKYTVSVRCRGQHVCGSPFQIKVSTPPRPEKVRVYGPGLEDMTLGEEGQFSVKAGEAGTGVLSVRVHGPSGAFKIQTSKDPKSERTIIVKYNPTCIGKYKIEVTWSTVHIPGSPFSVWVKDPVEHTMRVADTGREVEGGGKAEEKKEEEKEEEEVEKEEEEEEKEEEEVEMEEVEEIGGDEVFGSRGSTSSEGEGVTISVEDTEEGKSEGNTENNKGKRSLEEGSVGGRGMRIHPHSNIKGASLGARWREGGGAALDDGQGKEEEEEEEEDDWPMFLELHRSSGSILHKVATL